MIGVHSSSAGSYAEQTHRIHKKHVWVWMSTLLIGFMTLLGCDAMISYKVSTMEQALLDSDTDSLIKLGTLIQGNAEFVCVLHPYQESISQRYRESGAINTHLRATNYRANESHWAFVSSEAGVVSVYRFKRSKELDIFSSNKPDIAAIAKLPANFEASECGAIDRAAFFKILINDRIYIIFAIKK